MNMIERARALRKVIERMAGSLPEGEAVENIELFPEWIPDGHEYNPGDRVRYNGELYKVLQAHSSQDDWAPESAAALFAKILPGQDGTEIGEWVQPDSTNPYMNGDKAHFPTINDPIYISKIDNNVWAPDVYGWELFTE